MLLMILGNYPTLLTYNNKLEKLFFDFRFLLYYKIEPNKVYPNDACLKEGKREVQSPNLNQN